MIGDGLSHSASIEAKNKYYINCEDSYGNANGECMLTVKPTA
jgi:hypothetical protein